MPTNEAIYGFSPNVVASTVGEDYVVEIMREYLNTVNVLLNFPQPTPREHEPELILCLHTIKSASLMVGASKAGKWAASLGYSKGRIKEGLRSRHNYPHRTRNNPH